MPRSSEAATAPQDTLNWAGEIADATAATALTAVEGCWTVPTIPPSTAASGSAEWIGVGGGTSTTSGFIQVGTDQEADAGGTTYSAWYEVLPAPAVTVADPSTGRPLAIAPGDHMEAGIAQASSGLWHIDMRDVTAGWTASGTVAYGGTTAAAEWIVEAPTVRARIETLADFQTVRFTDMQTVPAAGLLRPVDMVAEQGTVIAYPGQVVPTTTREVSVYYGAPGTAPPTGSPTTGLGSGYDLADANGDVFTFGPPQRRGGNLGSLPGTGLVPSAPIVGIVATADDRGYFLVGADGGVYAFGDAPRLGSLPGIGIVPNAPIVGMAASGADRGYYLVGADGGVFAFGDAPFLGSLPGNGVRASDIVGMAETPSASGYWLIGADGEVYAFGAARRFSTVDAGASPVTGIAVTPTGRGYWAVTAKGAVENFGTAECLGTLPHEGVAPNRRIVGIVPTRGAGGYWLIGADGGVFAFGDAPFLGSLPGSGVRASDIAGGIATET